MTVERSECGKAGVVKPERHADAEHGPGDAEHHRAVCRREHKQAAGQHDIGDDQHAAPATAVDDAPHGWTGECRYQQCS